MIVDARQLRPSGHDLSFILRLGGMYQRPSDDKLLSVDITIEIDESGRCH